MILLGHVGDSVVQSPDLCSVVRHSAFAPSDVDEIRQRRDAKPTGLRYAAAQTPSFFKIFDEHSRQMSADKIENLREGA
jgi:hypothetical protein